MNCSPPDPDWLARRLAALLGTAIRDLAPVRGGGNNGLYRAITDHGPLAVKSYPRLAGDTRDRLGRERAALGFLNRHQVAGVPRLLAACPEDGLLVMEWIAGTAITQAGEQECADAVALIRDLRGLTDAEGAETLGPATEACLSTAELARQIRARLARLSQVEHPDLAAFLGAHLMPEAERRLADAGDAAEVPPRRRILSPSDFGFHNALRGARGRTIFVDFEYFGWDDPVKLVADTRLHPGMEAVPQARAGLSAGLAALFDDHPGFRARLARHLPLYVLRWSLILLNEFLPERLLRRQLAGAGPAAEVQAVQLAKARRMLARIEETVDV